jgi:hypothetical protein
MNEAFEINLMQNESGDVAGLRMYETQGFRSDWFVTIGCA